MIAKIAVSAANFAIDKPYSYFVPEGMLPEIGMRVTVPFGRGNKTCEGIVLALEQGSPEGLKTVLAQLDEKPLLTDRMLHLASFLRQRCYCSFYDAVRGMLPAGLWFQTKEQICLTEDRSWQDKSLRQKDAVLLLQALTDCGGSCDASVLRQYVEDEERLQKAISYLLGKKWITAHQEYSRRANDKSEKIATLASSQEEALEYASGRPKSAIQQRNILQTLCAVGSASVKELCYYTGAKPAAVKRLAELGYIHLWDRPVLRCKEIRPAQVEKPLILNDEQQKAFEGLSLQMAQKDPGVALLYGVTGSGKTAVYIRLIQQCIENGKQAVLLVPEIALTPQLLGLMAAWFEDGVAVLHSSLPVGERYDQWKQAQSGQAKVVVGTRSAVFAPCKNLGLMIIDEEQEHSYKSDNSPRYHARDVALWRGLKEQALVVLGSATPSVESMYKAKTGIYQLYTLKNRFGGRALPQVEIVDMKEEVKEGNDTSLSHPLQDALGENIQNGKQSILFLNRRGNSRAVVCVDCGEAPECPRCSVRLTYHSANERLMCHYCGFSQPVPKRCPACGGPTKRIGVGTQKVQEELQVLFPDVELARMDADTVSATNTHQQILDKFQQENTPVLVGTQMVAKGLNLPNVTLVGVLDGDLGLYNDSFRAAETTFNMLTQVVGRAGRGDTPGKALIQTLVPEHQVIRLAAVQDYDRFYELEIGMRKTLGYPPFQDVVQCTLTGPDEARVLRGAAKLAESLRGLLKDPQYGAGNAVVLGPAPCPVPKINYNFRYRLTLRCSLTGAIRNLLGHLLRQFSTDKDNRGVSAFIDINGYD